LRDTERRQSPSASLLSARLRQNPDPTIRLKHTISGGGCLISDRKASSHVVRWRDYYMGNRSRQPFYSIFQQF
jgi:hypothetical protein